MSLYSELLGYIWSREPRGAAAPAQEIVLERLRLGKNELARLRQTTVTKRLTVELRHDIALLTLCEALGLQAGPENFGDPVSARYALLAAIEAAGYEI
ncbi:MAG: hypothetical protein NT160_03905 [Actinobacteria bacterium]|nr:hypothetical protein [Actinomycetota bacterium]